MRLGGLFTIKFSNFDFFSFQVNKCCLNVAKVFQLIQKMHWIAHRRCI
eukprot:UN25570